MTFPLSLSNMVHHARWQKHHMIQDVKPWHLVGWISEDLLSLFKEPVPI